MTALANQVHVGGRRLALNAETLRASAPGVLVGLALLYSLVPFVDDVGGRGPGALTRTAVVGGAALIAVRPWQVLRPAVLAVAAAISVAALLVCVVTSPGWLGANRAASYDLAAVMFVTVAAYARTPRRRAAIASLIVVAGAVQFFHAFLPWWGGGNPAAPMVGTFYWHNQLGAFMLAPALIGAGFAIANEPPWRFVAWISVPFAVAGVVFSSSRGSQMVLAAGWILLAAGAVRQRRGVKVALARLAAISVLSVCVTFAMSGPPFFDSWHVPWKATQQRAASGETLAQNGGVRLYLWRESVAVFEAHPVVGVGYGALAPAATKVTPSDWPHSPLSHNDYLQSLVDGGLMLGVPFVFASLWLSRRLLVRLLALMRRRIGRVSSASVAIAAAAMMAHAFIDFDWSYPALFATAATVLALPTASATWRRAPRTQPARRASLAMVLTAVLVAALAVGAVAGRGGGNGIVVPLSHVGANSEAIGR